MNGRMLCTVGIWNAPRSANAKRALYAVVLLLLSLLISSHLTAAYRIPPPPHATPCWLTHQLRSSIEAAAKNEWETPRRLGSTRISARVDRFEYCEHPDTHQKGGCGVAASETRSTRFMFKVNVKRSTTRRTRPGNRQRRRLFTDDGRRRCRR